MGRQQLPKIKWALVITFDTLGQLIDGVGLFSGTILTALVQSSSAVTVTPSASCIRAC